MSNALGSALSLYLPKDRELELPYIKKSVLGNCYQVCVQAGHSEELVQIVAECLYESDAQAIVASRKG